MLLHIIRLIELILYLFTYNNNNSVIHIHVSFRRDKSDCHPQEGLVEM
jgi:hypothetical protein